MSLEFNLMTPSWTGKLLAVTYLVSAGCSILIIDGGAAFRFWVIIAGILSALVATLGFASAERSLNRRIALTWRILFGAMAATLPLWIAMAWTANSWLSSLLGLIVVQFALYIAFPIQLATLYGFIRADDLTAPNKTKDGSKDE